MEASVLTLTRVQSLTLILAVYLRKSPNLAKPHLTCEFKTQEDKHDLIDTTMSMKKDLSAR